MKNIILFTLFAICFAISSTAVAHDGAVNRRGCHTDPNGTNYHCHKERRKESLKVSGADVKGAKKKVKKTTPTKRVKPLEEPKSVDQTGFNNRNSNIAFAISYSLIGAASLMAGAIAASQNQGDSLTAFSLTALPPLGSGLITSGLFSLQVGAGSELYGAGGVAVGLNLLAPIITSVAMSK